MNLSTQKRTTNQSWNDLFQKVEKQTKAQENNSDDDNDDDVQEVAAGDSRLIKTHRNSGKIFMSKKKQRQEEEKAQRAIRTLRNFDRVTEILKGNNKPSLDDIAERSVEQEIVEEVRPEPVAALGGVGALPSLEISEISLNDEDCKGMGLEKFDVFKNKMKKN